MIRNYILFILLLLTHIYSSANVRVLSIGISEYPESSGWNKLNAHNDVELMRSIFPDAIFVEDGSATRSGIEAQLKALAINAAKGDTVIVHFSGHGQQIITKNSAHEVDGVDEAIVPFDALKRKTKSYKGQNHLTDDVFGKAIDNIRKSVGPSGLVIALIDACHSDSMDKSTNRTGNTYRGTYEIFGSESMSNTEISVLRDAYHKQEATALSESASLSNVVYLSACRSDQRNYEILVKGKGYGSLTFYFCEEYKKVGISNPSALLAAIYSGMVNNPILKFHGQIPAIRNTIGWKAPAKVAQSLPNQAVVPDDTDRSASKIVIPSIIAASLILISIALWTTRKK